MSVDEFDTAIKEAASNVSFGPLNGFGGQKSGEVIKNLSPNVRAAFNALNVPTAILAGHDSGQVVRHYAEACGKDVEQILANF